MREPVVHFHDKQPQRNAQHSKVDYVLTKLPPVTPEPERRLMNARGTRAPQLNV